MRSISSLVRRSAPGRRPPEAPGLSDDEVERFITDGFVHVPGAFPPEVARRCTDVLWDDLERRTDVVRADPTTWTEPVVRLPASEAPPFVEALRAPRLVAAIDSLVGAGRWDRHRPEQGYGGFPIRFPSEADPGDAGWHVDSGFESPMFRANLASRGRALLLLMLLTDTTSDDAPALLAVGSQGEVARSLVSAGDEGRTGREISEAIDATPFEVVEATGPAGDAYLCHPFLVHSATFPHRGDGPRFLGHPCIHHAEGPNAGGFSYRRADGAYAPTEIAVRRALGT